MVSRVLITAHNLGKFPQTGDDRMHSNLSNPLSHNSPALIEATGASETLLHGVIISKTTIQVFIAVKISNLIYFLHIFPDRPS